MAEPYVITSPCIDTKDKACVEVCPVQCIYEIRDGQLVSEFADGEVANTHQPHPDLQHLHGDSMLYINPDECTACDACMPVCPVTAIFPEGDVPAEWKGYTEVNAAFFTADVTGLGSPGGAAQVGPASVDHPTVTAFEG